MSLDLAFLGIIMFAFLGGMVLSGSTGEGGLRKRGKRQLLLAYSYRNALALSEKSRSEELRSTGASSSDAGEKSHSLNSEHEEGPE